MADPPRGALVARITEKGAALDTQLLFFGLEIADLDDDCGRGASRRRRSSSAGATGCARCGSSARTSCRSPRRRSSPRRPSPASVPGAACTRSSWARCAWSSTARRPRSRRRCRSSTRPIATSAARPPRRSPKALDPGLRTRTFIFNTILVDKWIDDRLRGYPTWISSRNLRNDTTDEAVQALVDATVSRYDVVQRYYTLKAKLVGLDRITFYDRFAPIGEDPSKVSWDEARDIVVEAYSDFAQEAGDIAERFFSERWIDAPVRDNKRTGAFCATTVPGVHPYVLMNFTGDRRSILTLAHELGHGLHGALAQPLGLFNADTPLTTAETASVFGEALTFKRLLELEDDPGRRLNLLAGRIEDSIATVFRQIAMNRFEDLVHNERRDQGELAPERLEELWLQTQRELFADSVDIDGYGTWWSYIPHFLEHARVRLRLCVRVPLRALDLPAVRARGRRAGRALLRGLALGRLEASRGAGEDRRPRPDRRRHLGERDRRARG